MSMWVVVAMIAVGLFLGNVLREAIADDTKRKAEAKKLRAWD